MEETRRLLSSPTGALFSYDVLLQTRSPQSQTKVLWNIESDILSSNQDCTRATCIARILFGRLIASKQENCEKILDCDKKGGKVYFLHLLNSPTGHKSEVAFAMKRENNCLGVSGNHIRTVSDLQLKQLVCLLEEKLRLFAWKANQRYSKRSLRT